jgi:hypothetical protein
MVFFHVFFAGIYCCNFDVENSEGGALPMPSLAVSPPECRLRHFSDKQKPALTEFTTSSAWQRPPDAHN